MKILTTIIALLTTIYCSAQNIDWDDYTGDERELKGKVKEFRKKEIKGSDTITRFIRNYKENGDLITHEEKRITHEEIYNDKKQLIKKRLLKDTTFTYYTYDEAGNLAEEYYFDDKKRKISTKYKYENKNIIFILHTYWQDMGNGFPIKINHRTTYKYDNNNNIIEKAETGGNKEVVQYVYDEKNNIIKKTIKTISNYMLTEDTTQTYENGIITAETIKKYQNNKIREKITRTYRNGKLYNEYQCTDGLHEIANIKHDKKDRIIYHRSNGREYYYKYDEKDRLIEFIDYCYRCMGNTMMDLAHQILYKYNDKDQIVEESLKKGSSPFYFSLYPNDMPSYIIYYEYDKNGNMTKKSKSGDVSTWKYDDQNNVVEYKNKRNDSFRKNTYEYDNVGNMTHVTMEYVKQYESQNTYRTFHEYIYEYIYY